MDLVIVAALCYVQTEVVVCDWSKRLTMLLICSENNLTSCHSKDEEYVCFIQL